jgi:hypothetical protein
MLFRSALVPLQPTTERSLAKIMTSDFLLHFNQAIFEKKKIRHQQKNGAHCYFKVLR